MSLIPVLGRQRHVGLHGFKESLVYIASSKDNQGYKDRPGFTLPHTQIPQASLELNIDMMTLNFEFSCLHLKL